MNRLRRALASLRGVVRLKTPFVELELEASRLADFLGNASSERETRLVRCGETQEEQDAVEVLVAQARRESEAAASQANYYRSLIEPHGGLVSQPYSQQTHVMIQTMLALVDYAAGWVAFRTGIPSSSPAEAVLLPFSLVVALVFSGHSFGSLMRHLHVANYVERLRSDDVELPPAELFGRRSNSFYFMTILTGVGLASAAVAALLVRWESELPVSPWAFLLIGAGLAAATSGEAFLWTSPWHHMRDEIDEIDRNAADELAGALEDLAAARHAHTEAVTELQETYPRARLRFVEMRIEADSRLHGLSEADDTDLLVSQIQRLYSEYDKRLDEVLLPAR